MVSIQTMVEYNFHYEDGNGNYLMIKQIQSISFPSLSVLLLSSNQIESIENLSEISLPNL